MPRANWGVTAAQIDDFDREKMYKPYTGPTPPVGQVYMFVVKILKHQARTREKNAALVVGLELEPRNKDDQKFAGFFCMNYLTVADNTQGFYVPFLEAIGVSSTDFEKRTITDEEGNIKKIGPYRHTGDVLVLAQLRENEYQGKTRIQAGWFGPVEEDPEDEDEYDDEDLDPDEGDDDEPF